jgi:tetratricopeptide (TPR) repeat protein
MDEGTRVGPYVLGRLLAEGGMARVHVARHVETGAEVALKLPHVPPTGLSDVLRDMVRHEVQAMARLSHPHIVPVLDWGIAPGEPLYVAMPWIEDLSLRVVASHLDGNGLLALVDQLLDALAYAHDRGVIHRDIKARNLLVTKHDGRPHLWLTDFGIASLDGRRLHGDSMAVGTPTYMAPEQMRGDGEIGPEADLYAVGVLLYLMFEGRRPYPGNTLEEIVASRTRVGRPRFTEGALRPIPRGLAAIVERLLDDDPLSRYPSASALRAALGALHASGSPASRAVCLECGEPLLDGRAYCPVCETGVPTRIDTGPSLESLPTNEARPVIVLAVRAAESELVRGLLERAGARVRSPEPDLTVAALGAQDRAAEPVEAAELALSVASLARARVGIAPGMARLGGGAVLELDEQEALALASQAEPGEVLAALALRDGLAGSHRVERVGRSVRVHGPLPVRASMSDARLSALLEAAETVRRTRIAHGVTLRAAPGMGRSLALRELGARLEAASWTTLAAVAAPGAEAEPLGVVRAALRAWAGLWPGASRAHAADALEAKLGRPELARAAASALTDAREPDPGARARALQALGATLAALTERAPVLLAIDDLARVDATSRELLAVLLEEPRERPLLVVTSARPDDAPLAGSTSIDLPPLSDDEAVALLAEAGGLDATARARLIRRAAGHPARLRELARLHAARNTLSEPSADELATARLSAVRPDARAVVELASIAGERFWLPQLLAAAPYDAPIPRLGELVLQLVGEGVFTVEERSAIAGARELGFASTELARAASASIAKERAMRLHAGCAHWLEQNAGHLGVALLDAIAHHWERAGQRDRAAAWALRAGRRAEALGAARDALDRYLRALAHVDREAAATSSFREDDGVPLPVDVPRLLASIARLGVATGDLPVAQRAAERVLAVNEPARAIVRGQARVALAEIARMGGQPDAALGWLDEALIELGPRGDPILRAQLLGRRGWILGYVLGRNDEGRANGEEALRLVARLEVPGIESHLYSELGANVLRAGLWDRQLDCNERALALAREADELHGQVRAHINLSVCYTNRGALERAAEHASSAASMALSAGLHAARIIALNNLGLVRVDQGRHDEARRLLELVVELCDRYGIRDVLYETLPTLGRVLLAAGDPEGALRWIAEGAAIAEREQNPVGIALAARVEALVHAHRRDVARARACLDWGDAALGAHGDAYERAVQGHARALLEGHDVDPWIPPLRALGADPELEIRRWSPR